MAARPTLPAVLFDLDGTLLDTISLILESARYAFTKLERTPPTDEEWLAGVGIPLFTVLRRYAKDDADCAALLSAYREYQVAHHDRLTRCYDDVVDTVRTLRERGHPLAIVTSKSEALALRGLALVGLATSMDTIVGCDGATRHKPDPEPVRIALHRLDVAPHQAIFVGDSVHDVLAGNAAGVTTAAALWGAFKRDDIAAGSPTHYLTGISELVPILDRWGEPTR
ncbi:MAG TPA: HAD-IA family hydrolase [Gemmatimonadaceae bacterium]|nr:HAD-IA family hydrolase [Gemmatimonadaceae bacterium]